MKHNADNVMLVEAWSDEDGWQEDIVRYPIDEEIGRLLGHIVLSLNGEKKDVRAWCLETSGEFSTRSAYEYLRTHERENADNNLKVDWIWEIKTIPKVKFFLWQYYWNDLPTLDNLTKRGWQLENKCLFCE